MSLKLTPFPTRSNPGDPAWERWFNELKKQIDLAAKDLELQQIDSVFGDSGALSKTSMRSEDIERLIGIGLWQ